MRSTAWLCWSFGEEPDAHAQVTEAGALLSPSFRLTVGPPSSLQTRTTSPKMATAQLVSLLHSTRNREYLKCSASLPGSPNGRVMMRSCVHGDPLEIAFVAHDPSLGAADA
eukprot:116340-Pelagomonas_calceolata.AAC.1